MMQRQNLFFKSSKPPYKACVCDREIILLRHQTRTMSYFPLRPRPWRFEQRDGSHSINRARFYYVPHVIPPSRSFQSAREIPRLNPWRRSDETIIPGFFSIDGSEVEAIARSRQWAVPSPTVQFREDSKLTHQEQEKALKKLKKEVYNPVPKTLTRRLSLYYRDQSPSFSGTTEKAKESEEDGKRCAVCLEDFEPKEEVTLTPCQHMFHEDCIAPWVRSHGRCPVCRFSWSDQMAQRPPPIVNLAAIQQISGLWPH